ncbi:hypothetical protein PIB30_087109, partial [Stylosanthes scabra]|nr:hypothetical protein [Stylosanthes scabra]
MKPPEVLMPFFREAGLGQAVMLMDFHFDLKLLSAFVEKWRTISDYVLMVIWSKAQQNPEARKENFSLKMTWLKQWMQHILVDADVDMLREYARCFLTMLIGGYLLSDKSNNLVHIRWLPLMEDFDRCRR